MIDTEQQEHTGKDLKDAARTMVTHEFHILFDKMKLKESRERIASMSDKVAGALAKKTIREIEKEKK